MTVNGQTAPSTASAKPYKGPESYQVEDALLFFGRDDEADQLTARILASRFTLLHAQSGAGKTSLLNAKIIPGLETRGWNAYRILPQNDPVDSIRAATFQYILPSPKAEQLAVERAAQALAPGGRDLAIAELLKLYDQLEVRDPLRRSLVRRVTLSGGLPGTGGAAPEIVPGDPYFCRLLRSCIELDVFGEHLAAVQQAAHTNARAVSPISDNTKVSELISILSDPGFLSSYNKLVNELNVPGRKLRVFFEHLVNTYGRRRTRFGLVLILDQFEEVFTRFIDPGVTGTELVGELPDWKLRLELFDQLADLCGKEDESSEDVDQLEDFCGKEEGGSEKANAVSESIVPAKPTLPIRYVVSMRDEYIAQMDPIRRFAPELHDSTYHLKLLAKKQAEEAIQEPAQIFGYTYQDECFKRIIEQLTKEDKFVEPAHLQLVCDKLWNEKGRELAGIQGKQTGDGPTSLLIQEEVFESLGETKGILKSFFTDFLEGLDRESGLEILEMLEPLVTASGTRNIVERDRLINVPFRDGQKRKELLDLLINHTIVRIEPRLGGYFVEITHEFLIAPVLEAIRRALNKDPEYGRYRLALRTLERLHGSSIAGTTPVLSSQEFWILHRNQMAIRWDGWSAELMLRCAVAYGAERDVVETWLDIFKSLEVVASISSVCAVLEQAGHQGEVELLRLAQLRSINNERELSKELSREQLELIWRSQLTWARDSERDDVRYWTERIKRHG